MGLYTREFIEKDNGDPNCVQRKNFENYIHSYWAIGCQIATNIKCYEILTTKAADNLFKISSNFFSAFLYNTISTSVIQLSAFFSDFDSASVNKFLNFCEQNQKIIFTKETYWRRIGDDTQIMPINKGVFSEKLKAARNMLEENSEIIKEIKTLRDKVFAHFDKNFLVTQKNQYELTIDTLKRCLAIYQNVVNKIYVFYDSKELCFESMNISDIEQLIGIVNFYSDNKNNYTNF